MSSSELDAARVHALLKTRRYGRSLRVLAQTDSTNDDARNDAVAGAVDGHVVLADSQRSGRGSHGRTWASPAGSDLYLSIVSRPALSLADLPPLTLAVGLGVADAVAALLAGNAANPSPEVKWPNDVWLRGKKCAGILVEASSQGTGLQHAVIGIGLNVNRLEWPAELRATATSLRAEGAESLDRGLVLAGLLEHVERWVDRFISDGGEAITQALDRRLALRGRKVRCDAFSGSLLGVAPSGALRIATELGVRELLTGRLELAE